MDLPVSSHQIALLRSMTWACHVVDLGRVHEVVATTTEHVRSHWSFKMETWNLKQWRIRCHSAASSCVYTQGHAHHPYLSLNRRMKVSAYFMEKWVEKKWSSCTPRGISWEMIPLIQHHSNVATWGCEQHAANIHRIYPIIYSLSPCLLMVKPC